MNSLNELPGSGRWLALISASGWIFRVFGYIFAILASGLAFALLSDGLSFIASFIWKSTIPITIRQYAWIAGVLALAVGIPLGWAKIGPSRPTTKKMDTPSARAGEDSPVPVNRIPAIQPKPGAKSEEVHGFWPLIGFFAVFGLVFGVAVALVLVMCWFSLSASPFAPAVWNESIQQSAGEFGHGLEDNPGARWTSTHPILILLIWVPMVVLTTLGVAIGIVYGGFTRKRTRH